MGRIPIQINRIRMRREKSYQRKAYFEMRFICLLAALFACSVARAQWSFGVKAGVGITTQRISSLWDSNKKTGLLAGAFATYELNDHFDLQGELYYANRGHKTDIYLEASATSPSDWVFTYHYLCLPLMLKYFPTGKTIYIAAGPHLGYLINYKNDIKDWPKDEPREDLDWHKECNRLDFGLSAGIGAIVSKNVMVDVRYNHGLTNATKNGEFKNRGMEVSVGYMF